MKDFCRDTILYRQLIDDSGTGASFADYTLTGVLVREVFAVDPDMTEDGTTTLYFFPGMSRCTDASGHVCGMPHPGYGDLAVLHAGEDRERTLRIAEAGYFTGDRGIGHIRLKLR
jgi:hypothetical protein